MSQVQNQPVSGWTTWVGVGGLLMSLSGIFHILFGLGGVFGQDWYITTSNSAWLFDSSSWGWSMIGIGALLLLSASLLLAGNMVGRIIGVTLAVASLVTNIALFAAAPVWSTLAIIIDIAIIYAIVAHGGDMKRLREELH
jgi:hypothetical protein